MRSLIDNFPRLPRPGERITVRDEFGDTLAEGLVGAPIGGTWSGQGEPYSFTIQPTTKEDTMQAKIRITAGQRAVNALTGQTKPYCDVKIEADGTPEQLQQVAANARVAAGGICESVGIEPSAIPERAAESDADRGRKMHEAIDHSLPILRQLVGDIRSDGKTTTADLLEEQVSALAGSRTSREHRGGY